MTMRIIKEKSREYKGTPYYKYKVNIPEIELSKAGLKTGDELEIETKKEEIILRKKKSEN